jgi:phage tail sheath gpL-like
MPVKLSSDGVAIVRGVSRIYRQGSRVRIKHNSHDKTSSTIANNDNAGAAISAFTATATTTASGIGRACLGGDRVRRGAITPTTEASVVGVADSAKASTATGVVCRDARNIRTQAIAARNAYRSRRAVYNIGAWRAGAAATCASKPIPYRGRIATPVALAESCRSSAVTRAGV